jgi:hypothetical protein
MDISDYVGGYQEAKTEDNYVNYDKSPAKKRYVLESQQLQAGDTKTSPQSRTVMEVTADGNLRLCSLFDNEIKMTLNVEQVQSWADAWTDVQQETLAANGQFAGKKILYTNEDGTEMLVLRARLKGQYKTPLLVKENYQDQLMFNTRGHGCIAMNLFEIEKLTPKQLSVIADHMTQVKAVPNSFPDLWSMWALNNPLNPSRKPKILLGHLQGGASGPTNLPKVQTNHPFAFMYNNPGGQAKSQLPPTPPGEMTEISDTLLVEAANNAVTDNKKKKRKLKY